MEEPVLAELRRVKVAMAVLDSVVEQVVEMMEGLVLEVVEALPVAVAVVLVSKTLDSEVEEVRLPRVELLLLDLSSDTVLLLYLI
jgi:hypothetical protein